MLISWSFDAKNVIAIKIQLIAQPYRMSCIQDVILVIPDPWPLHDLGVPRRQCNVNNHNNSD